MLILAGWTIRRRGNRFASEYADLNNKATKSLSHKRPKGKRFAGTLTASVHRYSSTLVHWEQAVRLSYHGTESGDPGEAAHVDFESKVEGGSSYKRFKRSVPGAFNMGFIGSACTARPWPQVLKYLLRRGADVETAVGWAG